MAEGKTGSNFNDIETRAELDGGENEIPEYNPSEAQLNRIEFVYKDRQVKLDKQSQTYPQFNDRTLKDFVDDSEKRLNAYVLDKSVQGKEEWQANFATRQYANKAKALLAAMARELPAFTFEAVNKDNSFSNIAADIAKNVVRYSYQQGNPQEDMFFLGWSLLGKGTVYSYEGIHYGTYTDRQITAFDLLTGDVSFKEIEKVSYGEPISFEIPILDLLVDNFYIRNIQDQPSIIWDSYYSSKDKFLKDWGRFENSKFVKGKSDMVSKEDHDTYFHSAWSESINNDPDWDYVVSRYMSVCDDVYRVVANGVELYNGPMLWKDASVKYKKAYPIAKAIFEPFANSDFFYGNSLPNSAMGEGDTMNSLINSMVDKSYRSLIPPLLIGNINKDMLDLEDEVVTGDTKIYVSDISQVKQMELKGITDSDVKMLDIITRGFDLTTLDPSQQGAAEKYVTARAAVAADERARQLKGLFFMFVESLWLQKVKLRIYNALLAYTRPLEIEILGEENVGKLEKRYQRLNVKDSELSDGSRGTLAIQFVESRDEHKGMKKKIEDEERLSRYEGKPFEMLAVTARFLDDFSFMVQIISETLWKSSQALSIALTLEKATAVRSNFPEIFNNNKEVFFQDIIKAYGDPVSKYNIPKLKTPEQEDEMALALKGKAGGSSPNSQLVSDISGTDENNRISKLSGVEQ